MTATVLVVEDATSLQGLFQTVLTTAGYNVVVATSDAEARLQFTLREPEIVLLDLALVRGDASAILAHFADIKPSARVIALTATSAMGNAVAAMRAGAYDFLLKPFDGPRLLNAIENALHTNSAEYRMPTEFESFPPLGLGEMIGVSPLMEEVFAKVRSVARSMATVFISGESGTGKELCAQAVHANSNRADGPFVPLDCGAIPPDMLESEVFGHLKGSFSGAIATKQGAAAAADGGTLFLDEVCEMDLQMQTKLLRFLQTSTIQPLGAQRPHKVNTRIICATNRDPLEQVRDGLFREDLYYRLHVVPIHLPRLRDRESDAVLIARHALRRFVEQESKAFQGLSPEVEDLLVRLKWPGNVRQLLNTLHNAVVLHDGPAVTLDMLHLGHNEELRPAHLPPRLQDTMTIEDALDMLGDHDLARIEQLVIEHRIARCQGSIPRAAEDLGLSPSTIYRKRESWSGGVKETPRKTFGQG